MFDKSLLIVCLGLDCVNVEGDGEKKIENHYRYRECGEQEASLAKIVQPPTDTVRD